MVVFYDNALLNTDLSNFLMLRLLNFFLNCAPNMATKLMELIENMY